MADDAKAAELAERERKIAAREAAAEAREQAAADREAEARKGAAIAFADGLIAEGKLTPAGKPVIVDLHQRLAGSDEPVVFSETDSRPALAAFETMFKAAQPVVNLGELTPDKEVQTIDGASHVNLTARAHEIVENNPTITFSEAIRTAEQEAGK